MSPSHHNQGPLRRDGDAPHPWQWWLKNAAWFCAAAMTIAGCIFATLTFARAQVAAPIEAKVDRLSTVVGARVDRLTERDSMWIAQERKDRIAGDSNTSEKLDLIIRMLRRNR